MKSAEEWIDWWIHANGYDMKDLIRQAREEVREECAEIADRTLLGFGLYTPERAQKKLREDIAAAIRALDLK